jgi:Silicon transporter
MTTAEDQTNETMEANTVTKTDAIEVTSNDASSDTASEAIEAKPKSGPNVWIEGFKYLYSSALLCLSVFLVMAALFTEQTIGTAEMGIHPGFAFVIFWFLIVWLATMEGGQGCMVGLQPVDKESYRETHPITWKLCTVVHAGDNMERFIVGRQFLVVLVVFGSNLMSSVVPEFDVLGLPEGLQSVFLGSGAALILVTVMIGQLTAQVNAANCMRDFLNNHFTLYFVAYTSLAIEFSGLLHCVYLVQVLFAIASGNPVNSKEPPKSGVQLCFFWGRVLVSLVILAFALAVTLSALFAGKTTMWEGISPAVSTIIFFLLMCVTGLMEGIQIALFAVVNLPEEELVKHPIANRSCQLTFSGNNLQAFLIGRQILVTLCMFVVARIATLDIEVGVDENIFGVSDGVQSFFNTGLLGALITTIVASLAWRIIASCFPLLFLLNPLIYLIIRTCLILEASGICSASWLLARVHKKLVGLQCDEVYQNTGSKTDDVETGNKIDVDE